jgi:hypothetical protein
MCGMTVSNIYGEVGQHEVWKCVCKEGTFYVDTFQDYKVVHWNYPEIVPTQELIEKAKSMIEQKKNSYLRERSRHEKTD